MKIKRKFLITDYSIFLWVLVICVTVFAVTGLFKLEYDDNYHNLFRSDHEFFKSYEAYRKEFTLDENDFVIVATADNILSSDNLSRLQGVDQSLRNLASVDSVFSIFSIPSFSDENYGEALYPGPQGSDQELKNFRKTIASHALSRGVLVSPELDATLLVVTLNKGKWTVADIEPSYQQISNLTEQYSSSSLEIEITGIPALRTAVVRSTQRDQIIFQGVGIILCVLLGIVMFHNIAAVIVTSLSAFLGPLCLLGVMGYLGIGIDPVNVIVPTLLLILCFADSVHMVSHIRDRLALGDTKAEATAAAVRDVGPACVLTALTTIAAFLSLSLFSSTAAIQRFGLIGAGGMIFVLVSVVIFVPLLSLLVLKPVTKRPDGSWNDLDRYAQILITGLANFSVRHTLSISIIVIGFLLAFCKLAFNLPVDYRYIDHIPENNAAYDALMTTETKMGGGMPLRIFIDIPDSDDNSLSPVTVGLLGQIHDILDDNPDTHGSFSILNVINAMPESFSLSEKIEELDLLAESVLNRLVNDTFSRIVVSAYVADQGSTVFEPILDKLERGLLLLEQQQSGYKISISGLFVTSSRVGHRAIPELAGSLVFAAAIICIVLALGLRSIRLGLISILPNTFPIIFICAVMYFMPVPLQYITVLAFTVCLGIGVDDTVHYLYRYHLLKTRGLSLQSSLLQTSEQIGRALMITTIIVAAGTAILLLSASQVTRQFGVVSASAVVLALFGNLIILVALLKTFDTSRNNLAPQDLE